MFKLSKNFSIPPIFFILVLFFALSLPASKYAGTGTDEYIPAFLGIQILTGNLPDVYTSQHISFKGFYLPTNELSLYNFSLPAYLLIPFFLIFGINIISMKLLSLTIVSLTIIIIYIIIKKLLNSSVALLTTALLVLSTSFLHYSRYALDITEPFINFFFLGSIMFFILHKYKGKAIFFNLAMLFMGACFSIKLSILARLLALFCSIPIIYPRQLYDFSVNIFHNKLKLLTGILFFSLGAILFILFNINNGFDSFSLFNLLNRSQYTVAGVNNTDVVQNLKIRIKQFSNIVSEKKTKKFPHFNFLNSSKSSNLLVWFFAAAFLYNLLFVHVKLVSFIHLFYLFMLLFSIFTGESLSQYHLVMLYPFPQFTIACAVFYAFERKKKYPYGMNKVIYYISLLLLTGFIVINIHNLRNYHKALLTSPTFHDQECFAEELYRALEDIDGSQIYTNSYKIRNLFYLLSKGKKWISFINHPKNISDINTDIYFINKEKGYNNNTQLYFAKIIPDKETELFKNITSNKNKLLYKVFKISNKQSQ